MAFCLVVSDTVKFPVRGEIRDAEGVARPFEFSVIARRPPMSEILAMLDSRPDKGDFMRRVITGWSGVNDANGEAVAFSDAALTLLFETVYMADVVYQAYSEAIGAKGKEKN